MTLSAWVNFESLNAQLWTMGPGTPDGGGGLGFNDAGLNYADFNGSGLNANFTVNGTNFPVNSWCQIVVSRSSNSCTMFVNGLKVASETGLTPYFKGQSLPWLFGANFNFPPNFLNYFDFCHVALNRIHTYNRALADSEILSLYTNEASGIIPTASVVVKTIRVNMNHLVLGQTYQLQSSPDFITWTNFDVSFPATNSSSYEDVRILGTVNGFFRVVELQ
jgi:Concanavalin A-like lectin/glucanases superfamily